MTTLVTPKLMLHDPTAVTVNSHGTRQGASVCMWQVEERPLAACVH
jgi:hypothetical protein